MVSVLLVWRLPVCYPIFANPSQAMLRNSAQSSPSFSTPGEKPLRRILSIQGETEVGAQKLCTGTAVLHEELGRCCDYPGLLGRRYTQGGMEVHTWLYRGYIPG